jgi:hypothetical protein
LSRDKAGKRKVDIVHYTFFDPFFLTLWGKRTNSKYIVTVHDLIPLKFKTQFPVGLRGRIKWLLQRSALTGASAIITDSVCSQKDIASLTGMSESQIYVVPLAAGHTLVTEKMVKIGESSRRYISVGDINWLKTSLA